MTKKQLTRTDKRDYKRLYGLLIGLALAAILMSTLVRFDWTDWVRWYLGGAMLMFGGFKLIGFEEFIKSFPHYSQLAKSYSWYNFAYPLAEVTLGAFFVLNLLPEFTYVLTLAMAATTLYGTYHGIMRVGPTVKAPTLGNLIRLPLSNSLLIESGILAVLAASLVVSLFIAV